MPRMRPPTQDAAGASRLLPGAPDALGLDFANTRYWRGSPEPTEELRWPGDLLRWCEAAASDAAAVPPLRARWAAAPPEGEAAFAEALALREAIFRVFAAGATGTGPGAADVAALNAALAAAPARSRLHHDAAAGWRWETPPAGASDTVAALLAPVLWSAGDLLAGARRARVRQCANPLCGFLFLDDSKAGTRRWCSMASCGNRAKAHRHYARRRAATE